MIRGPAPERCACPIGLDRTEWRVRALLLVALVGCGGASVAPLAPDPGGTSNRRPASAGAEAGPFEPGPTELTEAEAFVGTWALSHDAQPWCVLSLSLGPDGELQASVVRFEDPSWTTFTIVRVKLDRTAGSLELLGDYTDYETGVTIVLTLRAGGVEGTAGGETYGTASVVRGARVAP